MTNSEAPPPPRRRGLLDQGGRLSSVAATFRRWRQDATELERMAEDGRGNGAGAQGLWTRRVACLHRPRHIPGLVRRPWHKPGQRRTQKVRRGGGNREIWPTGLTSTILAGRRSIAGPASHTPLGPPRL